MANLLILGAGAHGKVVADAALELDYWDNIVFMDDAWPGKKAHDQWAIVDKIHNLNNWNTDFSGALVAVRDNQTRMKLQLKLVSAGFAVVSVVHPAAVVSRSATLGAGSVVFAGAVVNAGSVIGEGAIIGSSASIEHDCILGAGVHISSGSHIGAGVKIGDYACVGIGSTINNSVEIDSNVKICAGVFVDKAISNVGTAVGSPINDKDRSEERYVIEKATDEIMKLLM